MSLSVCNLELQTDITEQSLFTDCTEVLADTIVSKVAQSVLTPLTGPHFSFDSDDFCSGCQSSSTVPHLDNHIT